MGALEPIPAAFGRDVGHTLDKSPAHPRADVLRRTLNPDIHSHSLVSFTSFTRLPTHADTGRAR